ncbi:MAG: peptidase C39 family protein [Chloroherpetonaceae bacterium]|nr:peptidase C39 family protein [Chthonomonadaceae bacterium]MDW8208523.1 peptidase C39 family protein [Chloroherpetonaceae bacterium]
MQEQKVCEGRSMLPGWMMLLILTAGVFLTDRATGRETEERPEEGVGREFIAIRDLRRWECQESPGARTLISPSLPLREPANEVIVSWNMIAPPESGLTVEVQACCGERRTRWYVLGHWTPGGGSRARESVGGQQDADGAVQTDILVLRQPASAVVVRLTLHAGLDGAFPKVKFLGISLTDTTRTPGERPPNRAVWGRELAVPGRSQLEWPEGSGWCSPASTGMVLAFWAQRLKRPELDVPVPEVARAVYDRVYAGTGNWPFNTAFAGGFPGMRAYVTRMPDIRALEDWIAAGVPPVVSVSYDLLRGRQRDRDPGHLMVCIGFTSDGDIVLNDPAHRPERGEKARSVYPRARFLRAWKRSEYTAYLIYPEKARRPPNTMFCWE